MIVFTGLHSSHFLIVSQVAVQHMSVYVNLQNVFTDSSPLPVLQNAFKYICRFH